MDKAVTVTMMAKRACSLNAFLSITSAKAAAALAPQMATAAPAREFGSPKGEGPGYQVGDRVRHVKFGPGTVTAMVKGGRDYEVTVDFDGPGTKKMFAAFAKLQKIE